MGLGTRISNTYNKLFRPLNPWEIKLQIVTKEQALVEVKMKEQARSKKEAEAQAIESLKKQIGIVVIDSHQTKR